MVIAYLPLLVMVIGILMYALCSNAKLAEVGRTAMWTGMLVTLLSLAQHVVTLR